MMMSRHFMISTGSSETSILLTVAYWDSVWRSVQFIAKEFEKEKCSLYTCCNLITLLMPFKGIRFQRNRNAMSVVGNGNESLVLSTNLDKYEYMKHIYQLSLTNSVGRALHRHRRGHGFESRSSLVFLLSFGNCLSCVLTSGIFLLFNI